MEDSKVTVMEQSVITVGWKQRTDVGIIKISGSDRLDFIHRLTTNTVLGLKPKHGVQTILLNIKGRIVDVLTVLEAEQHALLLCRVELTDVVMKWLRTYIIADDVKIGIETQSKLGVEILGNNAPTAVRELFECDVQELPLHGWMSAELYGESVLIVRIPSFYNVSYGIIATDVVFTELHQALFQIDSDIPNVADAQYEHQRIIQGYPAYPSELNENYNPLECGMLHSISFTKGCYVGQEVIARLDSYNKVQRHMVGIRSKTPVAVGDIIEFEGKEVGSVTSTSPLQHNQEFIGLAYVRSEYSVHDAPISVRHGGATTPSVVQQLPFAT